MEIFAFGLMILIVIVLWVTIPRIHRRKIHEKVAARGGEVIEIERSWLALGPFKIAGRGRTIYKFVYLSSTGERKEGWVKFGAVLGPDWRL